MKIKKLTIENFKSFQYPVTIDFPETTQGKNIFLIGGMNGAGKTSIMEAVNICLYGAKLDYIYKNINRKELRKGNAFVSAELFLEAEDTEEIQIKRSWHAGTVDKPKYKDLEEKLVVVKDGKRVSVQNKEIWQDFINATFPKSITQFFFFDGEKIQEIAADDHSEVRLKTSLEAALGIQYISRLSQDLLYLKNEERKGFIDISDEDIDFKESELRKEKSKLKRKIEEKTELQNDLDHFKRENEASKKRFQLLFNAEPKSREETRNIEKNKINLSTKLGQIENQIKNITMKYLPWGIAGNLFEKIKNQIEKEREENINNLMTENIDTLLKDIVKAFNEPYPLTDKALDYEKTKKLSNRLNNIVNKTQKNKEKILNLSEREAAKVLNLIDGVEKSEISILDNLLSEKIEISEKLKNMEQSSSSVTTNNEAALFKELQEKMEGYQTQIGRQSTKLNTIYEEILLIETKIKNIEVELLKLYEKQNISKERKDFIKECDDIASLLNTYIVKLRENKIHLLQEKTYAMYKLLSSKSGLIKNLVINDSTYGISIFDRNGHEIKKAGLSAGEKEVFAVSLLWGLAQTSQLNLPIIIDTPLSRLDSIHRDNIIKNYFPNAAEQIIILSTDTEVDNSYYKLLENNLCGAGKLEFSLINELTTYKTGYFWK